MSFFAARKPLKGSIQAKNTAGPSNTASSSTAGPSATAASTSSSVNTGRTALTAPKLVSVTRKVAATAIPQTLKERQALARAKRAREAEREQLLEDQRREREQQARRRKDAQDGSEKRRKLESKGKTKIIASSSRLNGHASRTPRSSASDSEESPPPRSKLVVQSSSDDDEGTARLGTPQYERKRALRVPRDSVAAPQDSLERIEVVSGEQVVRHSLADFGQYFPDLPVSTILHVEYPGDNAQEAFLPLKPTVKDGHDYHPIQDIISTVRAVLDNYLTPEQAMEHFKHVPNQPTSLLGGGGDFDFLNLPSPAPSRSGTPMSDQQRNTPEPGAPSTSASGSPAPQTIFTKQPLMRLLEKAFRRVQGRDFVAALEYYNSCMRTLKASGAIRANIIKMGNETGVPESLWYKITGQCYERTVGPRVEELKKYEAFSDSVYGELLPPFVAHIAGLTGLKEGQVMVDMGSGVGNCAVQMSLATGCKSYGFEYQQAAASIAVAQTAELYARSRLWGLKSGPCETHECDFLASPSLVGPALRDADVVIINNYVFRPETNDSLSLMFLDLKEGAKIVSLKPFVHQSGSTAGVTEITQRNAGSPASILIQSKPIVYNRGSVSWSDESGKFYIATVNRDRLRRFLEKRGEKVEF